jgi:MFS family permease
MTSRDRETRAVTALCLVQFVDVLGVTVVVTALPVMLRGVGADASEGTLVATGYAMFFGGLLMFGARVGDRFGHRRTITASLLVYALAAVLAGMAWDVSALTVARCLQGGAAATAVPSALHLLTAVTSREGRPRALAAWSAAGAAAGASGFVVGGLVTALVGWRVVFAAFVVVAAALLLAVRRWVPADGPTIPRPLNAAGSALLTACVMAAVLGATLIVEPRRTGVGVVLLVASVVLLVAFAGVDHRASAPLVPGRLVGRRTVRRGALASFANTATTSSVATLVTLYVQDTLGHGSLAAAGTLLPFSLAVVAGSSGAARLLVVRPPEHVSALGLLLVAAGDAVLLVTGASLPAVGACLAVAGLGIGLSAVAATSLGTDVPERERAAAGGLVNTAAQLGTALGVAAVLLLAAVTTGLPGPGVPAPRPAWLAAAALAGLAALVLAVLRPGRDA